MVELWVKRLFGFEGGDRFLRLWRGVGLEVLVSRELWKGFVEEEFFESIFRMVVVC